MSAGMLDEMATALRSETGSIKLVLTFTHGRCVQVYDGRKKVGPVIIPGAGQTLADVLAMLGRLVTVEDMAASPVEAAS